MTIIPSSLYLLHKFASFDRDNFVRYAVCSKCSKLYDMKDCTEIDHRGKRIVKHCKHKRFPRSATCGAPLAKKDGVSQQLMELNNSTLLKYIVTTVLKRSFKKC